MFSGRPRGGALANAPSRGRPLNGRFPMHTRRAFLAATTLGAAGLARGADAPKPKYKYIDIHTHLGTFYWGKELTVDGLLKLMDKHAIEKAVVLPLVSPE